jgi:hypothetical protein
MDSCDYPRLCGGTFFTLLLEAALQKLRERKKFGDVNNFTERDVFELLIKAAVKGYSRPNDSDNFKSVVGTYKSCNTKKSGRLPISYQANISTFDNNIRTDYQTRLTLMAELVDKYIDADAKGIWLIKALLELLEADKTIESEADLFVQQNGAPIKKAALNGIDEYCLPAFLLGVWHYIVKNVTDNGVGQSTYDQWCKPGKSANTREDFQSDIGEIFKERRIVLVPLTLQSSTETETTDASNGQSTQRANAFYRAADAEFSEEPFIDAETLNKKPNQFFVQTGANSKQIFANTVNIND